VGLLAANAIAGAILLVAATAGHAQVIPAYYERAARYDEEIDQAARNRALGWELAVAVERRAGGDALTVALRDAARGAPVTGARVTITGYHRARAARELHLTPAEGAGAPGRYQAPAPAGRGHYDLVIAAERGADRFVQRAVVEVP
jgi:nitrogen fixation protein FixH